MAKKSDGKNSGAETVLAGVEGALARIAGALERLTPAPAPADLSGGAVFVWEACDKRARPAARFDALPLSLLRGLDEHAARLLDNTSAFAKGLPANNALLWGARGAGKSALIKAVFAEIAKEAPLKLIELHRAEVADAPALIAALRDARDRCIVFCDDLSFEAADEAYKALKTLLEGGVEGRPDNVIFYATSNRKHLTPRMMAENEDAMAIRRGEAGHETTSLADRFGLSLGFYEATQADYLDIVESYARAFGFDGDPDEVRREALQWAARRGARSGRVAWQFAQAMRARKGGG
ncbi:MAG: ATP-binding protein [Parvularculaceae bacterium]